MNLKSIDYQIQSFRTRIIQTLKLQQIDSSSLIRKQKQLYNWLWQQTEKSKKLRQSQNNPNKGIFDKKFIMGMVNRIVSKNDDKEHEVFQNDIKNLANCIKKKYIQKNFTFESKLVPPQIVSLVEQIKDKKLSQYYGEVQGPLLKNLFIINRQHLNIPIEQVKINGLKLMMIQQKVCHKYQRNLIQQLFGRIFRQKGSLSLVIKIEVHHDPLERPYNLFCYIEDRQIFDEDSIEQGVEIQRGLENLKINGSNIGLLSLDGRFLYVNQLSMLQIILSQVLVLPVQSMVSEFIVRTSSQPTQLQLIKCNQQDHQQIIKQLNLRDHPSLRNPLLYFNAYIKQHPILISEAQKISSNKQLYACFYRCLQIVMKILLTDFSTEVQQATIHNSVCFNVDVLRALWNVFHKIGMISAWMKEVILPVKKNVTIGQIITHFCPIFNQISATHNMAQNFVAYRDFYQNVEMESYLGTISTKKSLQKYKDIFLTESQITKTKKFSTSLEYYTHIFQPVLHSSNLQYLSPIQSSYILYFACKYRYYYHPLLSDVEVVWREEALWQKCILYLKQENSQSGQVPFIDIGFDMLGYVCGVDVWTYDQACFERVSNIEETTQALLGVSWFVDFIRVKYELNSQIILSSLLEKSFKHKKFKVCRKLLQKGVRIRNFQQIIGFHEIINDMDEQSRQKLVKTIQQDSSQMHRLFKWQQLMLVTLKKPSKQTIQVQTLDFGMIHLPLQELRLHIKNGKVINNLSRKDHKFNSNRQIALISYKNCQGKNISFYIESSQYPILPYFYKLFLNQIGIPQIMPYYTCFFFQNKVYHIIEHLKDSLNYSNGLNTFKQEQLNALTQQNLIGQAIVISMIIPPAQLQVRDIAVCPTKATRDQIFIVDWHSFYCKDFMSKYLGKTQLNSKNSLFLLEKMNKTIDKKILTKYSNLNIQKVYESVFVQCRKVNERVNQLKERNFKQGHNCSNNQLLALLFEQKFAFTIVERMKKIRRALSKKDGTYEKGMSYMRLLQVVNSQISYLYQEIYNSNDNLLKRSKVLFDDDWSRSFLHNSLIQFYGSFSRLQEKDSVFPLHFQKFCFEGPTQNLVDVATSMIKLQAFKTGQIPQNLQQSSNQIFEYYMRNCDISNLQQSKKQRLSQIIKNRSRQHFEQKQKRILPLSFICIKSMQFIKDKKLANDVSFERVEELIVQACKFSDYELNYFPKTIQNILYLQLKQITGLKYIGQNVMYGKSIEIKHLKNLSVIDCNDLISIDLKCDILENLQLRNNKSLQSISVFSLNMKNVSIFNNPNLLFQNIGPYIIKGINILVCKLSCHGDLMKLYSEDYQAYITNVMRYLLIKFFQSSDSRYMILVTLLKLKEVEQSLFTMGGISNLKGVSTIFKNFSIDVEDKIMIQLFRIYLNNPYLRKISISDLLKSIQLQQNPNNTNLSIQRLFKLLNQSLIKSSQSKTTTQIKFQNTKFIFSSINLSNIKLLIDRIKLDKNFSLYLQNMKEQVQKQYSDQQCKEIVEKEVETIRYVSIEKGEIEKVNLGFGNCLIKYGFFERVFRGTTSVEEIMMGEENNGGKSPRVRSKYYTNRSTLKDPNQKLIKITNLLMENCTIIDDRVMDLETLERQIKSAQIAVENQQKSVKPQSQQLKIEQIISLKQKKQKDKSKQSVCFGSVRNLKMQNCIFDCFEILQSMPFLSTFSLYRCQVRIPGHLMLAKSKVTDKQNEIKKINKIYKKLFEVLSKLNLQTLDLENFLIWSNSSQQDKQMFDCFCLCLTKMKKLKKLKLNKNALTLQNIQKLSDTLNETTIQQLQLNNISLLLNNIKIVGSSIEVVEQPAVKQTFSQIFQSTTNLKSLSIQLNSKSLIQPFIISVSKNKSLIQLKLMTTCQIPSSILQPLNHNKTLSIISSNTQLPVWLLNHAIQNGKNISKESSQIKKGNQIDEKQISQINVNISKQEQAMNTTISLGSLNSFKGNDIYKIGLSLDGGGVRGMLLATELNYLATRVGYPIHKIFDCIGGTSIGGILALASAGTLDGENPIANTQQLMNLFTKFGKDIFKKSQIMQLRNLFDTKYSASSFQGVLKNYFKDSRLSNCLPQTNVIVTAVNRVDNKDYIFRSTQALLNRDRDFYMRDVARATSAAPTYFPSAEIKNVNASMKLSLVDGGVGMNNPSKLVIDQVKKIAKNANCQNSYFLLSLGTGKLPSQVIPQSAGLKDLAPIIDSFTESSAYFVERDLATNYKGHFFRVSPLINVKQKKQAELDNTSQPIVQMYRSTGLQAAKKYFENTVIFGKYRNMNLIEWLKQNTARKQQF